jgi:hypothetical protein
MAPPPLPPLTAEEVRTFVRRGFLVKRAVLDKDGCAAARDLLWSSNRFERLVRERPQTWAGGFPPAESTSLPNEMGGRLLQRGRSWIYREPMGDPLLLDLVPRRVMPWLEQLLGAGQVQQPVDGATENLLRNTGQSGGQVVRGIYAKLPEDSDASVRRRRTGGQHVDTQPAHVIVTAHIDALPPSSGGTMLWPGSHRLLHARNPTFSRLTQATAYQPHDPKPWAGFPFGRCAWASPQLQRDFRTVQDFVGERLQPEEFCGSEGDVVLWHARCFHAASPNYSAQLYPRPHIRQAVFYDCHRADMLSKDYTKDEGGVGGDQWFEWSDAVKQAAAKVERETEVLALVAAVRAAPAATDTDRRPPARL